MRYYFPGPPRRLSSMPLRATSGVRAMAIDPEVLSSLANQYVKPMTSIRGRRVQRLLNREYADAEYVLLAQAGEGTAAVLGLSFRGAALCATDGRGREASVFKWSHGPASALETRFDLHKDSLPVLGTASVPLARLREQWPLRVAASSVPPQARPLVSKALEVLE